MHSGEKTEKISALILSGILALVMAVSCLFIALKKSENGCTVSIISDKKTVYSCRLDDIKEEKILRISPDGSDHYNIIRITSDGVCITESDCKGGDCIKMGQISHSGETICCLPNRLIITISGQGPDNNEYDTVTY